jgi:copper chaperone CopZ
MLVHMKYLIIICLLLAFGCNNTGTKKNVADVKSTVQENVKTVSVELAIQGMTCLGCEQTIQSGISSLNGVKQVKATFKDGRAFVEFIPTLADTLKMKEKITASGYIVTNIKYIPLDTLRSKL